MEFVFGRCASGKTDYVLSKIGHLLKKDITENILLIVPEQSTFRMERKLVEDLNLDGLFNVSVLSFDRLVHVLLSLHGGRALESLDFIGKSMICRSVIDEKRDQLSVFSKSASKPGFEVKIAELFSELKRQDLSIDQLKSASELDISEVTKQKLHDIALLFDHYANHITQQKSDSEDLVNLAIEKAKNSSLIQGAYVFIDGFDLLTSQILRLLIQLIKNAYDVTITFRMNEIGDQDPKVFESEKKFYNLINEAISHLNIDTNIKVLKTGEGRKTVSREVRHLEQNLFAYPFRKYDKALSDLSLFSYSDKDDEIKGLCSGIIDLIDSGYRYRDIAVCISDISSYQTKLSAYLSQNQIPHFLDAKRKMIQTSFAEFVMSLLDFLLYKDTSELLIHLKSGFIAADTNTLYRFENHIKRFAIKGYMLKYPFNNDLEDFRKAVLSPILSMLDAVKHAQSAQEYGEHILTYFTHLNIEGNIEWFVDMLEKSGDNENALIFTQVFEKIIAIIDQCAISFAEGPIPFASFVSAIKAGLEAAEIGIIPPSTDEVLIGDFSRTVFPQVKALFILGLNDGKIPTTPDVSKILTETEKFQLQKNGINAGYRDRFFEERLKIYSVFSQPSDRLILSYHSEASDDQPSVLIKRICMMFPTLQTDRIDSQMDIKMSLSKSLLFKQMSISLNHGLNGQTIAQGWRDVFDYFENDVDYSDKISILKQRLTKQTKTEYIGNAKSLYNKTQPLSTSVSRVESYYRCPFKYFLDYGIKPKINEPFVEDSRDIGNFLHGCLNLFVDALKEQNIRWSQVEDIKLLKICDDVIATVVDSHNEGIFNRTRQYDFMLARLKTEFVFAVRVIKRQLSDTDVTVYDSEFSLKNKEYLKLTLDDKTEISLVCKIDRIDTVDANEAKIIRIIDYKSSGKNVDLKEVYYGTNIQLLVYLKVLMAYFRSIGETPIIGGAFYYDLRLLALENNAESNIIKQKEMKGFIPASVDVNSRLSSLDANKSFVAMKGSITKNGELNKNVKTIFTSDEFDTLFKHSENLVKRAMREILNGHITPIPFSNANEKACTYCDYNSICLFDEQSDEYRIFDSKKIEDFNDA
jgi:ATP-dependent helicase/nuclease subunit B